jgi:hypothetical protein
MGSMQDLENFRALAIYHVRYQLIEPMLNDANSDIRTLVNAMLQLKAIQKATGFGEINYALRQAMVMHS